MRLLTRWLVAFISVCSVLLVPTFAVHAAEPGDGALGSVGGPPPIETSSTHRNDVIWAGVENGKTSIFLRVCGDGPQFQLRSEHIGVWFSELFLRTAQASGCSPSTTSGWRMVLGADPGQTFRIYDTATETVLPETAFMQRAQRQVCRVNSPGAISCTRETASLSLADINEPTGGTVAGVINVRGWAADVASTNGTGVDAVTISNGAALLGNASYGQARSDVASVFGDSRFTNSGYTFTLDTRTLNNGPVTLRVGYHSTLTGQWNWIERAVTVNNSIVPPAVHSETRLRGAREFDGTTLWLQLCGQGQHYRFRSERVTDGAVLWDKLYDAVNGCTPDYRAVINAQPGEVLRFYTTITNETPSDSDFVATARRDTCRVDAPSTIRCQTGNEPPPPLSTTDVRVALTTGQAFDACTAPSETAMTTWKQRSPYRVVGVYIGGEARSCGQHNLTSTWVDHITQQGWQLIPIWVGPQAPCSTITSRRISSNVGDARAQGQAQADAALDAAAALGLVGPTKSKTVLYYDMENYATNNPGCRAAVNAFMAGWSSQLRSRNNLAGAYGSACGTAVNDWIGIGDVPDAVWIAAWFLPYGYRANASVFGTSCVPNTNWASHQRLRQYSGGHTETWGGVAINIDSSASDGPVATGPTMRTQQTDGSPEGQARPRQTDPMTTTLDTEDGVEQMQLVTPTTGWALIGGRLRRTTTGGQSWSDITPPSSFPITLQAVAFSDVSHGWSVATQLHANDTTVDVTSFVTNDAGHTWEQTTLLTVHPDDGDMLPEASYLEVLDSQTAWIALRLSSGANFSTGLLFKTSDGGHTWSQLSLPIGAPVRFTDVNTGWTVGGAAGDAVYVTHDGGQSWAPQTVVPVADGAAPLTYTPPTFTNTQNGVLPATRAGETDARLEFYVTGDGGQTWALTNTVALSGTVEAGTSAPVTVLGNGQWIAPSAQTALLPANTVEVHFISISDGWARTSGGACATADPTTQHCTAHAQLYTTHDGGRTWKEVQPSLLLSQATYQLYLPTAQR